MIPAALKCILPLIAVCLLCHCDSREKSPAEDEVLAKVSEVVAGKSGQIGFLASCPQTGECFVYNPSGEDFPTFSVFKFPLALAVMNKVDEGVLKLDQKVHLSSSDLPFQEYSNLIKKYPSGGVDVPLREILTDTLVYSDNNGCDFLLNLIGGPKAVQSYLDSIGVKGMTIASTEGQMHMSTDFLMSNKTTLWAMEALLKKLDQNEILSDESRTFIKKTMEGSQTGVNRIKALLPEGTVVAHKTGSGPRIEGIAIGINDAGIVRLPDGKSLIMITFVKNSKESDQTIERMMAEMSKAAWDYFVK